MGRHASSGPCAWALGVTACLSMVACVNPGLSLDDLPGHPIAITYWEPEDARRRSEIVNKSAEAPQQREGVARLDQLGTVLGVYDPGAASLARYPGYLALVDPRTGEVDRIEAATPGSRPLAWSDDRERLLFAGVVEPPNRFQLFEYDLESGLVRRLTYDEGSPLVGDYGPDRRLVYGSLGRRRRGSREIQMNIYLTGPYGASPELLLDGVATDRLAWSPLGSPMLYVRRDMRRSKARPNVVAREPVPGSEERDLAPGRDPVFTPDGAWIVYSGPVGGGWKLRRMRPDGSGRTGLGASKRDEVEPAVSPDSKYVAYIGREVSDVDRLYVRRMDGSGDRILLRSGGAASPAW